MKSERKNHHYSDRTWSWNYSSALCGVYDLLLREYSFGCVGENSITALYILDVRNRCLRKIRTLHTYVFELCRFYCLYFKYLQLPRWIYSQTAINNICTNTDLIFSHDYIYHFSETLSIVVVPENWELKRPNILYPVSFNPLNTKRRLPYLKTQFVPRSKNFSSRL